jgi:hypothetical protein
LTGKLAFGAKL